LFALHARQLDLFGGQCLDITLGTVDEETAQRDEMIALSDGGQAVASIVFVAVEPKAPFAYQLRGDLFDFDIARKLNETLEVEVIVFGSLLRPTTLNLEVFDKIDDQLAYVHRAMIPLKPIFCDVAGCDTMDGMTILEALILGLIQGLTEFIPISSSGHLVIAQYFMSGASDHLFLEWINLGTVLALIIYFRVRIFGAIRDVLVGKDYRLAANVIIAMLPAGLVGFFGAELIETQPFFGSVWTVVVTLFVVGVLLVVLEKLPKLSVVKDEAELPRPRALTIGLVQVLALIPGTSRSGSTIIAGRLMGLNAAKAAEFSFFISIPIMLGVIAKLLIKHSDRAYLLDNFAPLMVGNTAALISGLVAVGFLMRYLEKHSLAIFGYYRIVLALVLVGVLLIQ